MEAIVPEVVNGVVQYQRHDNEPPTYPGVLLYAPRLGAAYAQEDMEWNDLRIRGGLRFEDDSTIAVDGRNRRMFRASTLDGRPIAQELVRNGHARWDGRGESAGRAGWSEKRGSNIARAYALVGEDMSRVREGWRTLTPTLAAGCGSCRL